MQQLDKTAPSISTHVSSALEFTGAAIRSMVWHVPTRALIGAALGCALGVLAASVSLLLAWLTVENGAARLLSMPTVIVLLLLPLLGALVFGAHGIYRGAARSALEIEAKLGLVNYLVDRVTGLVDGHVGIPLANLPLATVESSLKDATQRYLGSDDAHAGRGIAGWVLRRAKKIVVRQIDTILLSAFRAEAHTTGGGGIDLSKVAARTKQELSSRMGEFLIAPLDAQRNLLLVLFLGLGIGWFHLLVGTALLIRKLAG